MHVLEPLGLIALLCVPAILALYILRNRRAPQQVGSLLLWRRARVRSMRGRPWERFRPNLLLALQLLAALALITALLRPACVDEVTSTQRLVLVLDASASMGSRLKGKRQTRWEKALEEARDAIEASPGTEVAILRAGRTTRVVQEWSTQKERLFTRLRTLEREGVDATKSSIAEALLLGLQLHTDRTRPPRVVLVSDGAFDHINLPTQAIQLQYMHVGDEVCSNAGIGLLALRRSPAQRFHANAVCTVVNPGCTRIEGSLEITLDGDLLETHRIALEPGAETTFSVPIAADTGLIKALLKPPQGTSEDAWDDHLSIDNEAYAVLAPQRPLRILSVGNHDLVDRALRMHDRFHVTSMEARDYTGPEDYDVTVFTEFFPASIPRGRMLVLSPPPDNPFYDDTGHDIEAPSVASWDTGHPALYHVSLGGLRFGSVPKITPSSDVISLAEFSGEDGPLLLAGRSAQWRALVWVPNLYETDFPLHVSFPIFLYNAVGWLSPGGSLLEGRSVSAGEPLVIPSMEGSTLRVEHPDGTVYERAGDFTDADGARLFTATQSVGLYNVTQTNPDHTHTFAVSMNNPTESDITPRPALALARGGSIASSHTIQEHREWWPYALLFFLLVVCVEWAFFVARNLRSRRSE